MKPTLTKFFLKVSKIAPKQILNKFASLKASLAKASMRINFEVYIGLILFSSILAGTLTFIISFGLLIFTSSIYSTSLITPFVIALMMALISGLLAFGISYIYPLTVASARGSKIDANLPIISNFMAVLASSGMPPEGVFYSLARVGKEFKIDKEAKDIVRDISLRGKDLNTALKSASESSPSRRFTSLIDGFVTTSTMGGDLASYLRSESDKFKRDRMLKMKRFLDSLGVIAEAYIAFMVAAPLMLIVMLSVMSFIGGDIGIGNIDPAVLLNILTFVFMPAGVAIMLFMVDAITPMR
jgi:flagellar protein FlaJ